MKAGLLINSKAFLNKKLIKKKENMHNIFYHVYCINNLLDAFKLVK